MMMHDCYKSVEPKSTIHHIKEILMQLNIFTRERVWFHPYEHIYSCEVEIINTGWSTFGKGITREFCLASAYGELIEEINTGLLFQSSSFSRYAIDSFNFRYDPAEEVISNKDFKELPEVFKKSFAFYDDTSTFDFYKDSVDNESEDNDVICYRFNDLLSEKEVMLPVRIVSLLNGSNGICAGNTREEALVHGLSEILERYAIKQFFLYGKTAPVIPNKILKIKFPLEYSLIREIEKADKYKIIVKDCTLNNTIPVLAILLIDIEEQLVAINFGSDPDLRIALHRCLTEILQNEQVIDKKMNPISFELNRENDTIYSEYNKFIKSGTGKFPYSFFLDVGNSAPIFNQFTSIQEKYEELICVFSSLGAEMICVRECSYIAIYSYQIIIPSLSEVFKLPNSFKNIYRHKESMYYLKNLNNLNNRELETFVDSLEMHIDHRYDGKRNFIQDYVYLQFDHMYWDDTPLECLLFVLYLKLENITKSHYWLKKYLLILEDVGDTNTNSFSFFSCIYDLLEIKIREYKHIDEEIVNILSVYYDEEIACDAYKTIANIDYLFDTFEALECFECDTCCNKSSCNYAEKEKVYLSVKKYKIQKYKENSNFVKTF